MKKIKNIILKCLLGISILAYVLAALTIESGIIPFIVGMISAAYIILFAWANDILDFEI